MRREEYQASPCTGECAGRVGCRVYQGIAESQLSLKPNHTAEELCVQALLESYGRRGRTSYRESFESALFGIELGLADSDDKNAKDFFELAKTSLTRITEGNLTNEMKAKPLLYQLAMILKTQLPAFRDRRLEGCLTPETVDEVRRNMIDLLVQKPKKRNPAEQLRLRFEYYLRAEMELAALLLRGGREEEFPYWATRREEGNQLFASLNHDWYLVKDGKKAPMVQVKTNVYDYHRYAPEVLVVVRSDVVSATNWSGRYRDGAISKLLGAEIRGNVSDEELTMLDEMTDYMLRKIADHEALADANLQ